MKEIKLLFCYICMILLSNQCICACLGNINLTRQGPQQINAQPYDYVVITYHIWGTGDASSFPGSNKLQLWVDNGNGGTYYCNTASNTPLNSFDILVDVIVHVGGNGTYTAVPHLLSDPSDCINPYQTCEVWVERTIICVNCNVPDLTAVNVWTSPSTPIQGQSCTLFGKVRNVGAGTSPATSFIWRWNGNTLTSTNVQSLTANQEVTVSTSYTFSSSGNYQFQGEVVSVPGELSYTNNYCSALLTVLSQCTPIVSIANATEITQNSAKLNGSINPNGYQTTWRFHYIKNGTTEWMNTSDETLPAGSSAVNVSKTINSLQPQTLYDFYLYANNQCGEVFSPSNQFTTSQQPTGPNCAILPYPENNATNVLPTNLSLMWNNGGGDPTSYDFYFGTPLNNLTFRANYPTTDNQMSIAPPDQLSFGTQYFWKIVPKKVNEPAQNCDIWNFSTGSIPECTTYPTPANGANQVSLNPILSWSAPSGPVTGYKVYFGNAPDVLTYMGDITSTQWTPSQQLTPNSTYYWQIIPFNNFGVNTNCEIWHFTTLSLTISVNSTPTMCKFYDPLHFTINVKDQNLNPVPNIAVGISDPNPSITYCPVVFTGSNGVATYDVIADTLEGWISYGFYAGNDSIQYSIKVANQFATYSNVSFISVNPIGSTIPNGQTADLFTVNDVADAISEASVATYQDPLVQLFLAGCGAATTVAVIGLAFPPDEVALTPIAAIVCTAAGEVTAGTLAVQVAKAGTKKLINHFAPENQKPLLNNVADGLGTVLESLKFVKGLIKNTGTTGKGIINYIYGNNKGSFSYQNLQRFLEEMASWGSITLAANLNTSIKEQRIVVDDMDSKYGVMSVVTIANNQTPMDNLTFETFDIDNFSFIFIKNTTQMLTPQNNSINVPINPIFSWSHNIDTVTYNVQIATDSLFNNIILDSNSISQKSFHMPIGLLNYNTTYWWRERINYYDSPSIWTVQWKFLSQPLPVNLPLQNITINDDQSYCYNAFQTITVAGNGTTFTIQNGGYATMIAGQNIIYLPTTTIQNGGYLWGYIAPEGPFCVSTSMPAVLMRQEEPLISIEKSYFKVYPNPTTGNFILELNGDIPVDKVTVEVYGIWAEKPRTETLYGERKHEFSLSDRPSGVYFIRVISGDKSETLKIIKQ